MPDASFYRNFLTELSVSYNVNSGQKIDKYIDASTNFTKYFKLFLSIFSINKSPQKKEPDGPDAKVTPCKRHRKNSQYGYENS